jgi:exopolysaccharide biosynthesis predicted pyruvyltransferase EpsI
MEETLDRPPHAPGGARLRALLLEAIDAHLDGARRVALLDFPDHGNVGDSAIWLGEREALRALGVEVVYACSCDTYDRVALRRRLGHDGVVLLHGGGNFGDLYPRHQRFREHVLGDLTGWPVVQLPQTLWFEQRENVHRAREAASRHGRFSMLVRDHTSAELAREVTASVSTSPDPATALSLTRASTPTTDVLWLLRADKEETRSRRGDIGRGEGEVRADWPGDLLTERARAWVVRQSGRLGHRLPVARAARSADPADWDGRAWARLARGIDLLSSARVVVTDRLHGHILSELLDIPDVALDNSYGKTSTYVGTWGIDPRRSRLADDVAQARRAAGDLLTGGR